MRKSWMTVMTLVLVAALLAGCSANKAVADMAPMESESMKPVMDYGTLTDGNFYRDDMSAGDVHLEKPSASVQTGQGVSAQKLIRTMDLEVETDNLDELLPFLDAKVAALGGYMEERSVRNGSSSSTRRYRYASMTIRVPVDRLDEMVEHISGKSNVVTSNESADDITLTYVATQSRVKALQVEQERLLELLAKAENMSDLLQIEARLTEVRTELEKVASQLRLYDNLVDYGTVRLNITEVQVFTVVEQETLWQRIGGGLRENWKSLCEGAEEVFVFVVTSLPFLIPLAIAAGITLVAVKLATRKKPRKEVPPQDGKE